MLCDRCKEEIRNKKYRAMTTYDIFVGSKVCNVKKGECIITGIGRDHFLFINPRQQEHMVYTKYALAKWTKESE